MRFALFLFILCCTNFLKAQDISQGASKISDTLHSSLLNENRYLWVQVPKISDKNSRFPVIYVLDGEVLFSEVCQALNRISRESGANVNNEAIVVGIGNIWQRYRDYTPTRDTASIFVDRHSASISGGGNKFISFMEKELFPHIETKYPASTKRILIGHSLSGLQAINILLKHPGMFIYYAAIDPSMWWDNQKLLNESKPILTEKTFEKQTLFLAVANTNDLEMDAAQIKKDVSPKTVLIRPTLLLAEYINSTKHNGLTFHFKFYKEYHHMTVPAPAMYDALQRFFSSQ